MNKYGAMIGSLFSPGVTIDDQLFIDAGSSNTRIYLGERLVFSEPTCVAVHIPTDTVVAIGIKAQKLLGKTGENIEVSFPVQQGVVASPKYMEVFLSTVIKRIAADFSIKRTLLGMAASYAVPAEASPVEKQFIREILSSLGFSKIYLIPAIEAAYQNLIDKGSSTQGYCLLDVGGQTTEIGIFSANSLVAGKTFQWGGVQFTEAIQDIVRTEYECMVGWHIAEQVKLEIGRIFDKNKTSKQRAKTAVRGKDVIHQVSKTVVVSSEIFEEKFDLLLTELFDNMDVFLAQLPSELTTNALDQGVYLTGSASQLIGLGEAAAQKLQSSVHYSKQPEMDTVKGMVKYAKNNNL